MISSPHFKLPKIILSTGFGDYEKSQVFMDVFQPLFGTGIFKSDGLFSNPRPSTNVYRSSWGKCGSKSAVPAIVEVHDTVDQPQFKFCRPLTRPFFFFLAKNQ